MMTTSCFNLWSAILSAIHLYSSVLFALWLSRQDSKCSINFFTMTIVTKIQPIKFLSIQLSDNSRSLSKYSVTLVAGLVYFRSRISSPLARMSDRLHSLECQIVSTRQNVRSRLLDQLRPVHPQPLDSRSSLFPFTNIVSTRQNVRSRLIDQLLPCVSQ